MHLSFDWDQAKADANLLKHDVRFEEAASAFLDESGWVIADPDHSADEDRFILLARSRFLRILVVSHCYRRSLEAIRIISARPATRRERAQYRER